MSWLYLFGAIIAEVLGTTFMKLSEGFTKGLPTVGMVVAYILCFGLLTLSLKKIDMSIAYAIWAGFGTSLISAIGMIYFNEAISLAKIISIMLIVSGVIGLNLEGH